MINYKRHFSIHRNGTILDVFIYDLDGSPRVDIFITDTQYFQTSQICLKDNQLEKFLKELKEYL